ncbi:hypothetical protein X971_5200 (plasmid) [Agrobacterium tumefaciens LBA4213 (Ach5)]|nr:hypothetical protein X971_5200 [Agrobacterium tumefaciens LBA4213 (Ach5)]
MPPLSVSLPPNPESLLSAFAGQHVGSCVICTPEIGLL